MGKSLAGRIHNGKAILRVGSNLGRRLIMWSRESSGVKGPREQHRGKEKTP